MWRTSWRVDLFPAFPEPDLMGSTFVRIGLLILLALCAPEAGFAQPSPATRLHPGDQLQLEVRDEPAMAGAYAVDDGGRVLLPIIGLVSVGGRDFDEVRGEIESRYARELQNREIRVIPVLRIAVMGEVAKPGVYPIDPTMRLGDVVALAGGLTPNADASRIEVVRDGRVVTVARQRDPSSLTARLASGDQVVVARRGWVRANSPALIGAASSIVVAVVTTLLLR